MIKSAIIIIIGVASYLIGGEEKKEQLAEVNQFMDEWHAAAARADKEAYFGAIAEDGVYIGTDKTEIWTKSEFYEWSTPYFDAGKAWTFVGIDRHIYFSDDGRIAWFDELARSTSGEWRGSGVLALTPEGWKIKQYVLSITVPNEIAGPVVKMIREHETR